MKKLLSMLAVSTLLGTSASNLKPMFTNTNVNHNFKSNQTNNSRISIQGENDTNPFALAQINPKIDLDGISVSPDGTLYAILNGKLNKSNDNGYSFLPVTTIPNKYSISDIAIAPNGIIYLGTNGLLKIKPDGSFEKVKDIPDIAIWSLTIDKSGKIYAGNGNGIVYKSTDGNTFTPMTGTTAVIFSLDTDKDGNVYAGTGDRNGNGIVYKSTDGNTFTPMTGIFGSVQSLAVDSKDNVFVATNNSSGENSNIYKSNGTDSFIPMLGTTGKVRILNIDSNNIVYAGTDKGLYKSDGINEFIVVDQIPNDAWINDIAISSDGTIYVTTQNKGLYVTNPINLLLKINKPDTFDKSWLLYNGIVYSSTQKIDIKENLVASAKLDNKSITIPTTDLDIPVGEHNLVLTLKDKKNASVFGGDPNTGQVTYKLWVKTAIDKNKIDYQTKIDDTQLYTGLVSNAGNTNNADIIQTKIKNGTGTHDASLNIDFKDILIDFDVNKSFYEQGTVDETINNFTATGSKQKITKNLSIKIDGIYHLHLVDTVGNNYDSYLELGESNWKLKGTFDDSELDKLKSKLNVIVNLTDPSQKSKALGWLHQYDNFVENKFNETIKTNGKGFDSEIKNQIISYAPFLKLLTYDIANEPKFDDGLDKDLLVKTITDKAKEILNNGLNTLPKNLNVDTKNVVNKLTLEHYTNWITNYQDFINKNKDRWINNITKIASRGFATTEQENKIKEQISQFLNNDNIKNYLKNILWEDNKLLKATSSDYNQFIELDKLQSDTINWVNTNMKDINIAYQQAIKNAESGLNLHGYDISEILNGKQKPQTKSEIDNFADGQSYHEWLQSQTNIKFHGWQLTMGLSIGIPLFLIAVITGCFIYRRTNPKYNGYWRGKKENKKDNKELIKSIKSPKKAIKKQENE